MLTAGEDSNSMNTSFLQFWTTYGDKTLIDRRRYFDSLSKHQQTYLVDSFRNGGWIDFFVQVYIDYLLDCFKLAYGLDLIDLRIKAIKLNKVFLIDKCMWDIVTHLILEWSDFYDIDIIFGGLVVSGWGKHKQFYKIKARKHLYWR